MSKASAFTSILLAAPLLFLAACTQPPAENNAPTEAPPDQAQADASPVLTADATDEQIIASAESAAPISVSGAATVLAPGADGMLREVRKGTNGWTCLPDAPNTPGPDPMCGDAVAMEWAGAWMAHKDPPAGKVGFMYMMAGGTDFSNTDPFASEPSDENHWIKTGPHVMIVGGKGMLAAYPTSADPDTTQPYVMWAGTPYEHLMIPVS